MSPSAQRRELALQLRINAHRIISATLRAFAQYLEEVDVRERSAAA